ncbi:hypothetical protein PM082_024930 [Marasmius tenuissimus]|nr:hypothetical protein PM082_024930 [Marasmius tenuissimus]
MFRFSSYLLLATKVCVCIHFTAPPTIIVGIPATATWLRDPSDVVTQINLVKDDPPGPPKVLLKDGALRGSELSGTILLNVSETGKYRLEAAGKLEHKENGEPVVGVNGSGGPQMSDLLHG